MLHRRNYESSGGMGAPASSTFSKRIGFTLMILFQVIPAGVVGVGYYVLAMAMTVYDGFISLLIQPVMGAFITLIAIVLLLIAGLPLRLIGWLNRWWRRHWWLSRDCRRRNYRSQPRNSGNHQVRRQTARRHQRDC